MTWATNASQRGASPIVIVTIDGIGEYAGIWKFCSKAPSYSASTVYKPLLPRGAWPRAIETRTNPIGGVAASGELSISLVDGTGVSGDSSYNVLTDKFRIDRRAQTYLSADQTAAATQVTLASGTGITPGTTVIFVGGEAQTVDSLSAGTTYNVTRGALGTTAAAHSDDDAVFLFSPYLYGRRVRFWLAWDDSSLTPATAEAEIGAGHHVDRISLGEGLATWNLRCRDRLKHLDRRLGRKIPQGFIQYVAHNQGQFGLALFKAAAADALHFGDVSWVMIGDEILKVDSSSPLTLIGTPGWNFAHTARGQASTRRQVWEINDSARIVVCADPTDDEGSFRYQDSSDRGGAAETGLRSTGTWLNTSAPVFCMLAVLTSSADPEATTDPDNYTSGQGNFSALPSGFGLGLPASLIDWDSFWDAHQRMSQVRLDYLTITKSETGREWLEREILRPTGLMLRLKARPQWPYVETGDDKLSCHLPRIPSEGDASTQWGDSEILTEETAEGDRRPMIAAELAAEMVAGTVRFQTRGPNGGLHEEIFKDTDFATVFGNTAGFYEIEEGKIDIDVPGARADSSGSNLMFRRRALRLLFRFRRPIWRIRIATDLSQQNTAWPGDLIKLSHSELPSMTDGTRGWTDVVCEVISKKVEINDSFVGIHWELLGFETAGRFGRIPPSGMIVSVSVNDVTIVANRYTDPQTSSSSALANPDSDGFADGDRVELKDRSGDRISTSPAYQTVQNVAGNVISLDGNFGGHASFTGGTVLEYANRANSVAQQHDSYVYVADGVNRNVGSSTQTPWTYGDP